MSQKSSPTDKLKSAVGKEDKSNKHITKITAKSASQNSDVASRPEATGDAESQDSHITNIKAGSTSKAAKTASDVKSDKKSLKKAQKSSKSDRSEKPLKEVFILARPFVALGRYIRDSWRELRQVRWPNRKATWKMTLAVLVYCAILMVFILLLDTLFTFLFNLILKS